MGDNSAKPTPVTFRPDYETGCCICDLKPTVVLVEVKTGNEHHKDLCGPCCFGEAACLDPANW